MIGSIGNRFLLVTKLLYLEQRSAETLTRNLVPFCPCYRPLLGYSSLIFTIVLTLRPAHFRQWSSSAMFAMT
jgi:hypothetical protein